MLKPLNIFLLDVDVSRRRGNCHSTVIRLRFDHYHARLFFNNPMSLSDFLYAYQTLSISFT